MDSLLIKALAKINLAIDVCGRNSDGYHDIDMVTIPLKLHDSLEIKKQDPRVSTHLYSDDPTLLCDESNLAYKALDRVKEAYNLKGSYEIFIHKKIPVEAGLGGGSADAAAVIKALDHFVDKVDKTSLTIQKVALSVGADVPFCLFDKPSRVRGIGEKLEEIQVKYPYYVLIIKPSTGLSTKAVYEAYDEVKEEISHPDIPSLIQALAEDDTAGIEQNMINVLSVPAIQKLPFIADLLSQLREMGLVLSGMSGTGSACFALSKDRHILEKAARTFEKQGNECYLTQFALPNA